MSGAAPRLELRGISKRFGSVEAVRDVSLTMAPGEIRGLCGHNGAGKSTLIGVITGLVSADAGEVRIDGKPAAFPTPRDAQRAGIAWVDQELSMVPTLSIAENIDLGAVGSGWVRRRGDERRRTRELLARVGLERHDPREIVGALGLGQRQLVEVARALGRGAQMLVLDEPTATLTDVEIELVFTALRRVAETGCAVLFVSHRLGEVLSLCDSVSVMRDGRVVAESPAREMTLDRLIEAMLGEQLEVAAHRDAAFGGEMLLRVTNLRVGTTVRDFSHEFAAGRLYGIAGQLGAGASEVLRALAGLMPAAQGEVELAGRSLSLRHPVRARRQGVGFVSNDRGSEGLFLGRSIGENLTSTRLAEVDRAGVLTPRIERGHQRRLAETAGIDSQRLGEPVSVLSGGNQQKTLVGRYLERSPVRVLLVDEPTRGVDIGGRSVIHRLLREAARAGMTVIFATSDLEELLELAETVITMRAGEVVGVYPDGVSRQTMLADLTHRGDEPARGVVGAAR
jgi:ABC-type sugar transport system ATPase subunit